MSPQVGLLKPLALLGAALALSACGSTVGLGGADQVGGTAASSSLGGGLSLATPDFVAQPQLSSNTSPTGGASAGYESGATGAPTSTDAASTGPTTSGSGTPAAVVANGPGVHAKTIDVGMMYAPDADQAQSALGNTAATQGDVRAESEAIVKYINSHGGAGGRTINVIYDAVSTSQSSAKSSDQLAQEVCAYFTQDHHVFMALPLASRNYLTCMAKAGAVSSAASVASLTEADYRTFNAFWDVGALSTDRVLTNLVDFLVRQNYFAKWDNAQGGPGVAPVKVGILSPDLPEWKDLITKLLVPELARRGYKVNPDDIRFWHFPDSASGNGGAVAAIQSEVLKFRSSGVTHLLPIEQNGLAFFSTGAESQGYRPRYGISSTNGAQSFAGTLVPYRQLAGATGVGFFPNLDLPANLNPDNGPYAGPGRGLCLSIMKSAGITFADTNASAIAFVLCDIYFSFRDAIAAIPAGTSINQATFMRALESLGTTFKTATLPQAIFATRKHYPVSTGYDYAYFENCQCLHYFSKPIKLR